MWFALEHPKHAKPSAAPDGVVTTVDGLYTTEVDDNPYVPDDDDAEPDDAPAAAAVPSGAMPNAILRDASGAVEYIINPEWATRRSSFDPSCPPFLRVGRGNKMPRFQLSVGTGAVRLVTKPRLAHLPVSSSNDNWRNRYAFLVLCVPFRAEYRDVFGLEGVVEFALNGGLLPELPPPSITPELVDQAFERHATAIDLACARLPPEYMQRMADIKQTIDERRAAEVPYELAEANEVRLVLIFYYFLFFLYWCYCLLYFIKKYSQTIIISNK